jgi:hypothetical protein
LGTTESPNPWAGVLLSDQEALQIIAVLADVHDGHDVVTRSVPPGHCSATGWAPRQVSPTLALSISPASGTASRIGPARGPTPNNSLPPNSGSS